MPLIDTPLDRIFEEIAGGHPPRLEDVWLAAKSLLTANYDVTNAELAALLSVDPGPECQRFVDSVLGLLFGNAGSPRSYTDWVRTSLLLCGLGSSEVPSGLLSGAMSLLISTRRTLSAESFIDCCKTIIQRDALESLV